MNACVKTAGKDERDAGQESHQVKHLGHPLYVQNTPYALNSDAEKYIPATITRRGSRSVVEHALSALESEFRVCVTGQPRIGKTRGPMMYALQKLLHLKAAVMYVGYKSIEAVLFLPDENGTYRAWTSTASSFVSSWSTFDERLVALIDPPEQGDCTRAGGCRILKFVPNIAEKYYWNWEKDGILLVTSMPSEEELLAMTEVLWPDERTPFQWDMGKTLSDKEKKEEIRKRMKLVGPVPRLVFHRQLFAYAVSSCRYDARHVGDKFDGLKLYEALRGTLLAGNRDAYSKAFWLNSNCVSFDTWRHLYVHLPRLKLTPIAVVALADKLEAVVKELRACV